MQFFVQSRLHAVLGRCLFNTRFNTRFNTETKEIRTTSNTKHGHEAMSIRVFNDENLIDSFVPKFLSESNRNESVGDSASDLSDRSADGDFEVEQFVGDSAVSLVAPPFAGWSFGGATGIVGNYYLDWTVDEEERISLVAGEIDSETNADREAMLTIDPLPRSRICAPMAIVHSHSALTFRSKTLSHSVSVTSQESLW